VVFIKKKSNQTDLKKKPKPVQTDRFWFGSVQTETGLARFFRFGSIFYRFGLVFFGLGSVRFGFFGFRLIKPKPNRNGWFFQNFNPFNMFFFHGSVFSVIFFWFSRFFGFFVHPYM
jgi:hypothetical protein